MDNGWMILAGTAIGAAAGLLGPLLAARIANRVEIRRLGIDLGLREWERMCSVAEARGGNVYPPALFVFHSIEMLKLLEQDALTAGSYDELIARQDVLRQAIEANHKRRKREREAAQS